MRKKYESNNKNLSVMTYRLYVSYVYTTLQWIWPVHYADLGFQLMPLQLKMAVPIRV